MRKAHLATIAAVSLLAVSLYAGGLTKYKNWDKSPQGYLMTAAERTEWASVRTDDDADKFVTAFLARRQPSFVTDVNIAAANANKYFSAGRVQGSTTARGKLVIILGPPGAISLSEKKTKGDSRLTVDSAMTVGGGGTGASVTDMVNAANGAASSSGIVHIYTFTYPADKLPAAYGKALVVDVEVDEGGGDRIDRKAQAELDRLYEMVAETKLNPPAVKQ